MSGHAPLLGFEPGLGKDRRRFIIISIFDATLSILLWLICTVTKGDDWATVFFAEINIFAPQFIHNSLFDVVVCAQLRMLILILCYAVLVIRHWIPVAITTTLSSAFIIVKVMYYFSKTQGGLPQYLLVLTSFSIAWFELWLMPFKVLPRERRYALHHDSIDEVGSVHPRPASVSSTSGHPPRPRPRVVDRLTASAALHHSHRFSTDDEFRSALDFSSDDEVTVRRPVNTQIPVMLKDLYEKALVEAETRVELLLREARLGNWKVIRAEQPMVLLGPDQSYFIRGEFRCSPAILFEAAWKDVLKWNPLVVEGRVVMPMDTVTELYYSVSAPAMKGYVASRDFVDVRRIHLDSQNGTYSGVFVSVESTMCPPNVNKKIVRGVNGPSLMRACRGDVSTESHLEWIMRTDLRGGLPKRLVQSSMLNYFVEHIERLQKYIDSLDNRMTAGS